MSEKIKIYDGSGMVDLFKVYIESLKVATESLQTAFSNISEFQKPLDMVLLKQILSDPATFFQDLQWAGQKWAASQRPMAQDGCSSSASEFVTEAQLEYSKWAKLYHSDRPKLGNRSIPFEVMEISNLDGLLSKGGFSKTWLSDQADKFNEYLESPLELEFFEALNNLSEAATKVSKMAGHWVHQADPIKAFLSYNSDRNEFTPIKEGIKKYVNAYSEATENA